LYSKIEQVREKNDRVGFGIILGKVYEYLDIHKKSFYTGKEEES